MKLEPTTKPITQSQFFPIGMVLMVVPFQFLSLFMIAKFPHVFPDEVGPIANAILETVGLLLLSLSFLGGWGMYLSVQNARAGSGKAGAGDDVVSLFWAAIGVVLNGLWLLFGAIFWLVLLTGVRA